MNIVTATFSSGCRQVAADKKLWQWDQGQILQIVGLDLPDAYQVEFSNQPVRGSAAPMIGGTDGVEIPDVYLTTGLPVYAFIVLHTYEDDRETEYRITIYVNARPQPTDVPPTPEQQAVIDQLIAALTAGVAKAEDAAAQAEAAISYMPKIVDGTWWVYDAEAETWTDTGIQAEGQDGVGISGAVLNADYTLTLTFSDGTSYTTPSIRGAQGERGPIGPTPDISIGTVTTGAAGSQAKATMTGTPEAPVLNLTIPRGDPGEVTQAELDALADEVTRQKSALGDLDYLVTGAETIEWLINTTFEAHGYITSARWMATNRVGPGTFYVSCPSGFRYQIFDYISDSQGTKIIGSSVGAGTYSTAGTMIISVANLTNTSLTAAERATVEANFIVASNDALVITTQDNKNKINRILADYLPLAFVYSQSIESGSDFNTFKTAGAFHVANIAIARSIDNIPVVSPGRLIVQNTSDAESGVQIFISSSGDTFIRQYNASIITTWKAFAFGIDYFSLNTDKYSKINQGADLNDYLSPGNYKVINSGTAQTVENLPVANAPGELIVTTTATANNVVQIFINTDATIYTRTHDARGWGNWDHLVKSSDAQLLADGVNSAIAYAHSLMRASDYQIGYANAPIPIALNNYLGNNQNVHPKVLYFQNRFGGHYFWMAYTPYPDMEDLYENPCVAFSDDGYVWANIAANPLDDPQGNGYDSDTHLVYREDTGVLECWYRYVTPERVEEIYRQTTTDGVNWTAKEKLLTSDRSGAAHYLSPAVIFEDNQYKIWVVDNNTIRFYTAPENAPGTWTAIRTFTLSFTDEGSATLPWHMDLIKDGTQYVMLVMCQQGTALNASSKWSLFITASADNVSYSEPVKVMGGSPYNWDKLLYRSSLVKLGTKYRIYYSGANYDRTYHLGISESEALTGFVGKYFAI